MQVLEQFMIGLGFKVDEKGAKDAQGVFDGLTKSALQLGGVLAGKLAIDKVMADFRQAGTEMYNFQKISGMTAASIDQIGFALQREGGNARDAYGFIKNIQSLIASPMTGNVGWMSEVARFGVDPNAVLGAKNAEDAILRLSDAFQGLTRTQQLQAGNALGLDDSQIRLIMKGRDAIEEYYRVSRDIGNINDDQTEDAKKLTEAYQDLDKVFESLGRDIAGELTPAVTELVNDFVELYKANKDIIDSGIKEFFGFIADNLKIITAALIFIGGANGIRAFLALRSIFALMTGGAAAAGAGSAAAGAGAAGAAGAGLATVGAVGLAAATYSSSLNTGEDEAIRQFRMGDNTDQMAPLLIDYFMKQGWSREQAQGIVANLAQESNFDPNAVGDGGKAYGIAQWHPDRQEEFRKFAGKDIRQSTLEDQLSFVNYELTKGRETAAGDKLRGAMTAYDAGSIVSRYYERPANADEQADFRGSRAAAYGGAQVNDNRQYIFNTNDEGMVRNIMREELTEMTTQTMQDFTSSQK